MYISLGLISLLVFCCSAQSHFSKILLQNVDKIVLREGQMANARRVSPIPQLRCVGGSAGCRSAPTPNLVICSNIGFQGGEVRWECEADFDQRYRFGRVQVSCEGYEHPDDTYILKDSCGLEYEIDYEYSHSAYNQNYYSSDQSSWLSLTNIIFFAVIGILIYAIYKNSLDTRDTGTTTGAHTDYTTPPTTGGTVPGTTGGWGNFMSGMFIGGFVTSIFNMFSSLFRPRHGYGSGYGSGYRSGYGYNGGMSSWGGGARRGYGGGWGAGGGGWGGSGGGSTSRKSAFGGTSRR